MGIDIEIMDNNSDVLNSLFDSPAEALGSVGANFSLLDSYMWFEEYDILCNGTNDADLPLDNVWDMAEYYIENPSFLKDLHGMDKFYDALENGIGDLDDEDEDEY